jgi:hypothetical protein
LRNRRPILLLLLTLAAAVSGSAAFANVCRSIQAELAAIGRSSGNGAQAARAAAEANRIFHHMRAIGCDRTGIFAFGAPPPPECASLRGRMHQLQQVAAGGSGSEARRRELTAMLASYNCTAAARPQPRGEPLVAGLFDDRSRRPSSLEIRPDADIDPPRIETRIRPISGRTVCVRTCDGYFFPVQLRPGAGGEEGNNVCRALCPASETRLFTMRSRDIEDAVSIEGDAYDDLPNAFLYRKRFNPACACRSGEQGAGAQVLNPDGSYGPPFETLNQDDMEPVEEPPLRGFTARPPRRDESVFGRKAPPQSPPQPHPPNEAPAERTVTTEQGEVREFEAKDGSKRTVRIIAPELSRGPSEARAPSAPDRAPAR